MLNLVIGFSYIVQAALLHESGAEVETADFALTEK